MPTSKRETLNDLYGFNPGTIAARCFASGPSPSNFWKGMTTCTCTWCGHESQSQPFHANVHRPTRQRICASPHLLARHVKIQVQVSNSAVNMCTCRLHNDVFGIDWLYFQPRPFQNNLSQLEGARGTEMRAERRLGACTSPHYLEDVESLTAHAFDPAKQRALQACNTAHQTRRVDA